MRELLDRASNSSQIQKRCIRWLKKAPLVLQQRFDVLLTNSFLINVDDSSFMGLFPNVSVGTSNKFLSHRNSTKLTLIPSD